MESIEEGLFGGARPLDRNYYKHQSGKDYAELAQKYQMQISIPSRGYFGISWVDQNGKERYEERPASAISSMDAMVEFALAEMELMEAVTPLLENNLEMSRYLKQRLKAKGFKVEMKARWNGNLSKAIDIRLVDGPDDDLYSAVMEILRGEYTMGSPDYESFQVEQLHHAAVRVEYII